MNYTQEQLLELLKKAQEAFANQRYKAALKNYLILEEQIYDDENNLPVVRIEIGWTYYMLQDFHNAINYFQLARESASLQNAQIFDCLRLTGFSYTALGDVQNSIAFLQDALAQPVEENLKRHCYFELGKIYFLQNNTSAAKPFLSKAMPLYLQDDLEYAQTTRYYLGFCAFFEHDYRLAETYFQNIIKHSPDRKAQAPGYFGLAHIFFQQKEYQALIDTCETVSQRDPDFFDKETLGYFLCCGYMALNMWNQLSTFLPELLESYPNGRYKHSYPGLQRALDERRSVKRKS